MKKAILLILLISILSIGFVSASENTTEINALDDSKITDDSISVSSQEPLTNDNPIMYVNSTKDVSGDGSSWENASKGISLKDNANIFLAARRSCEHNLYWAWQRHSYNFIFI